MICKKCGKEFSDGIFCPYCGKKNVIKAVSEKNGGKSSKWWIAIIPILVLGLVVVGLTMYMNQEKANRSAKFLNLLKSGNTEEANSLYQSGIVNDSEKLAETYTAVKADIDGITGDYYAGTISYDDAVNKLKVYTGFYDTDIEEAVRKMDRLRSSREAFDSAEAEYSKGNYKEAYDLYSDVISDDDNYETAIKHKEESYLAVKDNIMSKAAELKEQGKYSDAISFLRAEQSFLNAEDKKLTDAMIEECDKQITNAAIKKAQEYKDNQEYIQGIRYIDSLVDSIKTNADIKALRSEFVKEYEKEVTDTVTVYKDNKEFTEAIQFVRKARTELPESALISGMESELKDYLPISLSEVFCFQGPEYTLNSPITNAKDMYQNEYSEAFLYFGKTIKGYDEVWLVNSEYQHFSAWLAPYEDWSDSSDARVTVLFDIYADDVKMQEIAISRDSKPVKVEVDLTGVEKIKFHIRDSNHSYLPGEVLLADPCVYKRY